MRCCHSARGPSSPHRRWHFSLGFLSKAPFGQVGVTPRCGVGLRFLLMGEGEHLPGGPLVIRTSSLEKCLFGSLVHFFNQAICLSLSNRRSSSYIFISSSQTSGLQIFSSVL